MGLNLVALFHIYAVVITVKNGIISMVKTQWVKNAPIVDPLTARAETEIRSVWGGLYLGLGIAGLVFPGAEVYKTIAIVYIASNLVRAISMVVRRAFTKSLIQAMSYELILAVLLFL